MTPTRITTTMTPMCSRKRKPRDVALRDRTKRTRVVKPSPTQRVRTYQMRREVSLLKTKLDLLKRNAHIIDPTIIERQMLNNLQLRELLRNQQFLIAGLRSLMVKEPSEHVCSPVSSTIRLGDDPETRREQILAMKTQKLHDARIFLEHRTRFLDPLQPCSESTQFQTREGDTCVVKFDSVPLPGATSVKQVFDALTFYCFNLEICTAEIKGVIVVREEADSGDERVAHNRLVYPKVDGVPVETNNIVFAEFTPSSSSSEHSVSRKASDEGLVMTDFVDQDNMYPYRPHERVREDVISIFMVQSVQTSETAGPDASHPQDPSELPELNVEEEQKPVVVFTRWVQAKLHHSELPLSDDALNNARNEMNYINDAIVAAVRGTFRPPPPTQLLAVPDQGDLLLRQHQTPLADLTCFSNNANNEGEADGCV
ncbi:hypothetical protein FI667_g3315, partial [Globisporangium splendens]